MSDGGVHRRLAEALGAALDCLREQLDRRTGTCNECGESPDAHWSGCAIWKTICAGQAALAAYEAEERAKAEQPMPGVAEYTEVQRLAEKQFGGLCRPCDGTGETGGIIGSHYIGVGRPCSACGGEGER